MTPDARIPRRPDGAPPPLMPVQEGMWQLAALLPEVPAFTMPAAFRVLGALDADALREALREVVARHEVLRTALRSTADGCASSVTPPSAYDLPLVDLTREPRNKGLRRALARAQQVAVAPFDLGAAPLLRATLFRLAQDDHVLLLVTHHLVSDGWSVGLMLREISVLYGALRERRPSPLRPLAARYGDVAAWMRARLDGGLRAQQLAYWTDQLCGPLPAARLPPDRPGAPGTALGRARVPFHLATELSLAIRDLAQQEGATEFMVLLAALHVLLAAVLQQPDVRVGAHFANRARPETHDLLGLFAGTVVHRAYADPMLRFRRFLRQVRATALAAYEHADVPIEEVAAAVAAREDASAGEPLFSVMLQLQTASPAELELGGAIAAPFPPRGLVDDRLRLMTPDLILDLTPSAAGVSGTCFYRPDRFDGGTVRAWLAGYQAVLREATASPDARLQALL
ncbi:condensation domain-containing protein [Sorangium sp. So ce590]|uniref:condensation domain-containing protein n=1 Tax=Sorangium sp. So ce590 TaxID=3133317 RepID=UPI003F63E3FA